MTRGKKSEPRPGYVWDVYVVEPDGSRRLWGKNHPTKIEADRAWATAQHPPRKAPITVEIVERKR